MRGLPRPVEGGFRLVSAVPWRAHEALGRAMRRQCEDAPPRSSPTRTAQSHTRRASSCLRDAAIAAGRWQVILGCPSRQTSGLTRRASMPSLAGGSGGAKAWVDRGSA
eukprot:scaffold10560_cov133-Isochrysis_galbana.AAC.17